MPSLSRFFSLVEQLARQHRTLAGIPLTGPLDMDHFTQFVCQTHPVKVLYGLDTSTDAPCENLKKMISGLSVCINGLWLIVLNTEHTAERNRATLMEEFSHILLGHPPSTVSLNPIALQQHRTYNPQHEKEAYSFGAALLVPYDELRTLAVIEKRPRDEIANHFLVSEQLIQYRMQVTYVWRELKGQ
ncbi:MAG: ImmA/IrrE family metallo-endopeptidase [Pleurocapsa sp. SU_196_0]|nr:ImmA/IrrE family metallo-endopeptidase [Pleurocapsa sp. SU_196_0]